MGFQLLGHNGSFFRLDICFDNLHSFLSEHFPFTLFTQQLVPLLHLDARVFHTGNGLVLLLLVHELSSAVLVAVHKVVDQVDLAMLDH